MDSSSNDEGGIAPVPTPDRSKPGKRIAFKDFRFGRTEPTPPTSIYSSSPKPKGHPAYDENQDDSINRGSLIRTRSDEVGLRCKDEWAEGILAQEGLKESVIALRASVADYEKEATTQQWKDLLKIHVDIRELGQLAESSKKKSSSKELDESADGLSKFTSVAFEYSKLLDVVMNQSPEYAALAWGAIKFLLVAHVNHSKLKHSVQHYLIEFGRQFGVVNQLMTFLPTSKMLEAVSEAYAALSKFLAKAVKYYRESKLMSAFKAFGFPWETRFQMLVNQIEFAFKRIRDLASAGHYNATVQSQHLLRTISYDQQELRSEMHQDSANLRKQLKDELKDEVQLLFNSFDKNWIQRFEQIMQAAIPALPASRHPVPSLPAARSATVPILPSADTSIERGLPSPQSVAAIEYAESIVTQKPQIDTDSALQNMTFLADHIGNPKRLRRFRDRCFPHLHRTDHDDARLTVLFKHLTPMDLQQCMGLLRQESVKAWIETSHSSLLWVNTQKVYGIADWASSFSTRIIEYARKIDYITVLYHFCGNHPPSDEVSTAAATIQSMIMQILQVHHKMFARKIFPFTMEHFDDAAEDIAELWGLFLSCIAEAELPCVWFVLDNIDNLRVGSDWAFFVSALQELSGDDSRLFKIFATARGTGKESRAGFQRALAHMSSENHERSRVSVITVPRAISRVNNALYGKQKRPSRLPDHKEENEPTAKADLDDLLDSGSDDEPWDDKERVEVESHFVESPKSIKSGRVEESSDDEAGDGDLELSDSSLGFMKDDPFASSAESDWEKDSADLQKDIEDMDLEDSDNDFMTAGKQKKAAEDVFDSESSSEGEVELMKAPKRTKGAKKATNMSAKKGATGKKKDELPKTRLMPPKPVIGKGTFDSSESNDEFEGG